MKSRVLIVGAVAVLVTSALWFAWSHSKSRYPTPEHLIEQARPAIEKQLAAVATERALRPPEWLLLLPGYTHHYGNRCEDNVCGWIEAKSGFRFMYAISPDEGQLVDAKYKEDYLQFSEERINGYRVRKALTRSGGAMITVLFDEAEGTGNAANFQAESANAEQARDMFEMAVGVVPKKSKA
jgi:hypothetical protein